MNESVIQKFSDYGLIDNENVKLLSILKEVMASGNYEEIDITVGFLFLSGLKSIKDEMEKFFEDGGKMKIVMGSITNKETYENLAAAHHSLEELKNELSRRIFSNTGLEGEKKVYTKAVGVIEQNEENEKFIEEFKKWIDNKNLEIRVYTKDFMHAKAYVFKPKSGSTIGFGSVGSSNFTLAGLYSNTELNSIVATTHLHNLKNWFDKIWNTADDFNPILLNILSTSWASQVPGNFPSPYEVLIRGLIELYGPMEEKGKIVAPTIIEALYEFQKDAVSRAIDIVNKYKGVLISDVVGLGKSYIGLALLQHFSISAMFDNGKSRVAVFAPPKLKGMWESYLRMYGLSGEVYSAGLLLKGIKEDGSLDEKLQQIKEYLNSVGVILVDEAHKFSNPNSNSYANLQRLIGDKKVILLTATPYRKSFKDIVHQIQLFMPGEYHKFPVSPPKWSSVIREVEEGRLDASYILREIMVRRTRKDIITLYGDKKEERCIRKGKERECFPQRKLETVNYDISSIYSLKYATEEDIKDVIKDEDGNYYNGKPPSGYHNIYEVMVAGIRTLLYTRYDLFDYVKESVKEKAPYRDLKHAGRNLRGLMKTHYLKRLESSAHAFYLSLKRSLAITESFLKFMQKGYLPIGEEFDDLLYKDEESPRSLTDKEIEELIEEIGTEENSPLRKYKIGNFKIKDLERDLKYDIKKLGAMLKIVENVHNEVMKDPWKDEKLRILVEKIDDILYTKDRRKVLVFSEFEDTVNWIYKGLKKIVEEKKVKHPELWKGKFARASSSSNVEAIAAQFSPKSMRKTSYKAEMVSEEEEIDILITTDVMSEGMNLQDANYVVNYDIHWTPYKIIQRIGRIDRIGSEYEEIYVINFLPETELEKKLNLLEKVKKRAEGYATTLGEDGKIITEEDKVNLSAMKAIYGGNLEEIEKMAEKNVMSITTDAVKLIEEFSRKHPNRYKEIKEYISMRSAALHDSPKTVALFVCSNGVNPQYYTYEYVDGKWERTFLSLDFFIKGGINEDTPPYNDLNMNMYRESASMALKEYENMLKESGGVRGGKSKKIKSKYIKDIIKRLKRIMTSYNKDEATKKLAAKYKDLLEWGISNIDYFEKDLRNIVKSKKWREKKKDKEFLEAIRFLLENYNIPAKKKDAESRVSGKEKSLKPHITAGLLLVSKNSTK